MTTTSTSTPKVPPRGPEYDARIQRLMRQGTLDKRGTDYLIIRRPISLHSHSTFEYGLACLACETVTWDKHSVTNRQCPECNNNTQ